MKKHYRFNSISKALIPNVMQPYQKTEEKIDKQIQNKSLLGWNLLLHHINEQLFDDSNHNTSLVYIGV